MIQWHFGGGFGAIAASHLHKIRGEGLGLRVWELGCRIRRPWGACWMVSVTELGLIDFLSPGHPKLGARRPACWS